MQPPVERGRPRKPHQDTIAGLAMLAFCAVAFWLTTQFESLPAMLSQNVPATFFPRLVLSFISIGSIVLIVGGSRRERAERHTVKPSVVTTAGIVALAPFSISLVGTLPTIALLSIVLPLLWRERRLLLPVLLAVCLPTAVYLVFTVALGVRFPLGLVAAWIT